MITINKWLYSKKECKSISINIGTEQTPRGEVKVHRVVKGRNEQYLTNEGFERLNDKLTSLGYIRESNNV